jgi:homogentisate 1,2-dioxygenase
MESMFYDRKPPHYQSGFGNEFATEAVRGTLPVAQNSPQRVAHGLYAEQISGTAFTAPRHVNRRSWLYRIRPAAMHQPFAPQPEGCFHNRFHEIPATPNPLRWSPWAMPTQPTDFLEGLTTMAGNAYIGIHVYAANRCMRDRYFFNSDAEMLIVPQEGRMRLTTVEIEPQEIAVIPRGIRFRANCRMAARAVICARTLASCCGCRTWGRPAVMARRQTIKLASLKEEGVTEL